MAYNLNAVPVTPVKQRAMPVVAANKDKIAVTACGETLHLEMQCAWSLPDLTQTLQQQLQKQAQDFSVFDVNGTSLTTDNQLHSAIARGKTPLCAELTSVVHQRDQDLQWTLIKDQMTILGGQMSSVTRQADDTQAQLERFKQETTKIVEDIQVEVRKQLEGIRESLGSECANIRYLMEKDEAFEQRVTDILQEQQASISTAVDGLRTHFEESVRAELANTGEKVEARFLDIENGCTALQNRLSDLSSRQAASHMSIAERHERLFQVVEGLKVEEKENQKQTTNQIQASLDRMQAMESGFQELQGMIMHMLESQDDQLLRSQWNLHADHKKQISELEIKLNERLERESEEQKRNVQAMLEEGKKTPRVARLLRSRSVSLPVSSRQSLTVQTAASQQAQGQLVRAHFVRDPGSQTTLQTLAPGFPRALSHASTVAHTPAAAYPPVPLMRVPDPLLGSQKSLTSGAPLSPMHAAPGVTSGAPLSPRHTFPGLKRLLSAPISARLTTVYRRPSSPMPQSGRGESTLAPVVHRSSSPMPQSGRGESTLAPSPRSPQQLGKVIQAAPATQQDMTDQTQRPKPATC